MRFALLNGKVAEIEKALIPHAFARGGVWSRREQRTIPISEARYIAFFSPNGFQLSLEVYSQGGVWLPNDVHHIGAVGAACPYCGETAQFSRVCLSFDESLGAFFRAIVRHPDVRLKAALKFKPFGF